MRRRRKYIIPTLIMGKSSSIYIFWYILNTHNFEQHFVLKMNAGTCASILPLRLFYRCCLSYVYSFRTKKHTKCYNHLELKRFLFPIKVLTSLKWFASALCSFILKRAQRTPPEVRSTVYFTDWLAAKFEMQRARCYFGCTRMRLKLLTVVEGKEK